MTRRTPWIDRLLSLGLVAVLLTMVGCAIWSSAITQGATADATNSGQRSDLFRQALEDIALESSLLHDYWARPDPNLLPQFAAATATGSLQSLADHSTQPDDAVAAQSMVTMHRRYLLACWQLFAAVQHGDNRRAAAIDDTVIEPLLTTLLRNVQHASADQHDEAVASRQALQRVGGVARTVTLLVFGVGLALLAGLWFLQRQRTGRFVVQLQVAEARYRALTEHAADLVSVIAADGTIRYASPSYQPILGYLPREVGGQRLFTVVHPDDVARMRELFTAVLQTEGVVSAEFRMRHHDGSWRTMETIVVNHIADPAVGGIIATTRDITARKRAEEVLQFQAYLLDMVGQAVIAADLQGTVTYWNRAAETLYGWSSAEAVGRPMADVAPAPGAGERAAQIVARLHTGQVWSGEIEGQHRNGRAFPGLVIVTPVYDVAGTLAGSVGVTTDITVGKEAEEQIRRLNVELEQRIVARTAELEEAIGRLHAEVAERQRAEEAASRARDEAEVANRAKSEFLSRMSHELRTPLNAILGFGQILEMRDLGSRGNEGVGHILKAGRHLLGLIDEVLDISRIEAGRISLSIEPIDVVQTVGGVLDLAGPVAVARHIELINEVTPLHGWYLLADQQRLTQVLLNLVSNAIKYNRDGGQVTIGGAVQEATRLRLLVRDTGAGLHPAELARLFVPFERLGAASRGIEGTGIGLVLSRRLMEAMGGTIGVESVVGEGSTFWVDLPLTESPIAQQSLLAPAVPLAVAAPVLPRLRTVLYVEDNLSNIALIEHLLSQVAEVRLLTALQGSLGLELAREHTPDLILLDIHLPDMLGDEVLRRLQADPRTRHIPVVVLSADAVPGHITRLREAGATAYLTKPLDVQQFLQTVREIIDNGGM